MTGKDLDLQLDQIIVNTEDRLLAVVKQSINAVIDEAQTPVAKGGKMRVDTGFLRASGVAALNTIPSGLGTGRKRLPGEVTKPLPEYDREEKYSKAKTVTETLAELKIGDAFYFGWTANYAKFREAHDGFLESAVQNWQLHVNKAVEFFRKKDGR